MKAEMRKVQFMPALSMVFGILMIALGVTGYAISESKSMTALIPCIFGALLIVSGLLAKRENMRKHAMHAAAMVGLLGVVGVVPRVIGKEINLAVGCQIAFAVLSGVFVILCVRSFINARVLKKSDPVGVEKP